MLAGFGALPQRIDAAGAAAPGEGPARNARLAPLRIPLVTNVDASIITSGDEAREALVRQVTLPVRWEDSMRELIEEGATTFVEVGPGRVLSGLLRQIERSVHASTSRTRSRCRARSSDWRRPRGKRPRRPEAAACADRSCSA